MGIWNWFSKRRQRQKSDQPLRQAFTRVKKDFTQVQETLWKLSQQVQRHEFLLEEHTQSIQTQISRVTKLEDMVTNRAEFPINPPTMVDQPRIVPAGQPNRSTKISDELNLDSFSPQEKKLLSVFLMHRDMALSYQDIAKSLGKSPHTIKNQVHQIALKSELFDKSIDSANRNRFKLKKNLSVKTRLNPDPSAD